MGQCDQEQPDYLLRLRSVANHPVPAVARMRRLLKALGRAYGFRVLEMEEVKPEQEAPHEGG